MVSRDRVCIRSSPPPAPLETKHFDAARPGPILLQQNPCTNSLSHRDNRRQHTPAANVTARSVMLCLHRARHPRRLTGSSWLDSRSTPVGLNELIKDAFPSSAQLALLLSLLFSCHLSSLTSVPNQSPILFGILWNSVAHLFLSESPLALVTQLIPTLFLSNTTITQHDIARWQPGSLWQHLDPSQH